MITAVLGTIPLGLGIALNPLAVVASILILRKPDAGANGLAFVAGWAVGLHLLVILPTLLVQAQISVNRDLAQELPAIIWIASGAVLVLAAIRALRQRSGPDEQPPPPRWAGLIDNGGPLRMFGLGVFLAMVSLRNLVLMAAAAGVIGQARLPPQELVIAVAIFITVSTLGLLIPLLMHLTGGAVADTRLATWGDWLIRYSPVITGAVMLVLGLVLLARGLGDLF